MSFLTLFRRPMSQWFAPFFPIARTYAQQTLPKTGQVFLVGAGPGDPELLTLKAWRLLQQADVVLYDALISPALLALIPKACQQYYVGKRAGQHALTQPEICQKLQYFAQQGHTVVRLKGGDPAIFGRVNEEAAALQAANIPFAIVPGITTACAAAAYTGIALTARNVARSVTFLTAQFADPKQQPNWQQWRYQTEGDNPTLVVYMGLSRLPMLCQGLRAVGWPASTPIALIEQVSCPEQRLLSATLEDINDKVQQQPFTGPTLIMIGDVIQQPMAVNQSLLQSAWA
ncbi:uroporphyrinogen-III C-methyltransferase [Rheinheimera sp. UJ63]|uniref:uroporphyrinogen-III C-methyltransferase n=1 Tax=Rheinheimera sp. UJ63 TaxID=2910157 RepID=UPI001F1E5ACE|nr:uroporphyrinogen-III C-methyltransferase [Rheinheimera sp. UJ63]MCF4008120.1 uroporphyrinogen-III C-methyltransferase [Rheinheimera sp. UJ63]